MLLSHLAVDIAAFLSTLLPVAFSPESGPAVFGAILHAAVIVVTKLTHLDRTFWDAVVQGTTTCMAELLHEDWATLDAVFELATLSVALSPQPDSASNAAVLLGA